MRLAPCGCIYPVTYAIDQSMVILIQSAHHRRLGSVWIRCGWVGGSFPYITCLSLCLDVVCPYTATS